MKKKHFRLSAPTLGSFSAVPSAFSIADKGIQNVMKFEFNTIVPENENIKTTFTTDVALIDLAAVDSKEINFNKMSADCDLLKEVIQKFPDELRDCLDALKSGNISGIKRVEEITKRIGLTEDAFSKCGGGIFWLAVPLVIAGLSACGSSNKLKNNKTIPTSTQNPKPNPDAGSGDGG